MYFWNESNREYKIAKKCLILKISVFCLEKLYIERPPTKNFYKCVIENKTC